MAATIIDSLVVLLNLDPAGFTEGQKKALAALKKTRDDAGTTAKEMESRGKQGAQFFTNIKTAAQGLFTVLAGNAVARFVVDTARSVAATGRLAASIKESSGEVSAYANMIARNGGNAEAAAASFKSLSDAIEELHATGQGSRGLLEGLGMIGATGFESQTELRQRFNRWAQGRRPQEVGRIGRGLGLNDDEINQARKSVEQYDRELAESVRITERDAVAGQRMEKAWEGIGQQLRRVGIDIQTEWTPAISGILEGMTKWIEGNKSAVKGLGEIGIAIAAIIALKPAAWLLKLLAVSVAKHPVLAGIAALLHSSEAGEGEEDEIARMRKHDKPGSGGGLLALVRKLEGSGDSAVSPAGAIGRYQIMPATAKAYGFDPSRLKEPAYNEQVATAILNDLSKKYGGNVDQILANYNSSPRGTKRFMAGGDASTLPAETQAYLSRAHQLIASGNFSSGGAGSSSSEVSIGTVQVTTKDAGSFAKDLRNELSRPENNLNLAVQANQGLQ